ncbi:hypothetical protein NQ317_004050 [Molorchus minor]|uniref:Membrane protein BRI3 n=1 Tax=Molorchus minor TaxID=1323400 RepID=A0ABQ9IWE4_9CUCU|nr:hypothetical protein NQ317_004050 [Molorchus minor]
MSVDYNGLTKEPTVVHVRGAVGCPVCGSQSWTGTYSCLAWLLAICCFPCGIICCCCMRKKKCAKCGGHVRTRILLDGPYLADGHLNTGSLNTDTEPAVSGMKRFNLTESPAIARVRERPFGSCVLNPEDVKGIPPRKL